MPRRGSPRDLPSTNRLFAVVDDPADAPGIVNELRRIGVDADGIALLRGSEGAERIDASGAAGGTRARLRQLVSFTLVDQMPDFIVYEAAVRAGRVVLAIAIGSDATKAEAVKALRAGGAHFINYYGRFATEEHDLWRGPELDIPGLLRR